MKNTKEVQSILTAIYCLNRTSNEDKEITSILDYAFRRLFNTNTNLLLLTCVGQTHESIKTAVMKLLEQETQYKKYIEETKH